MLNFEIEWFSEEFVMEKGPFRSNSSFYVSACMYVLIQNGKLHMNKHRFPTEYFTRKRERELHNVQFSGRMHAFPFQKCVLCTVA